MAIECFPCAGTGGSSLHLLTHIIGDHIDMYMCDIHMQTRAPPNLCELRHRHILQGQPVTGVQALSLFCLPYEELRRTRMLISIFPLGGARLASVRLAGRLLAGPWGPYILGKEERTPGHNIPASTCSNVVQYFQES